MKAIKRVSFSLFLLLLFSFQFSCSVEKQVAHGRYQSDDEKATRHGHDGSFKGCSACLSINKSITSREIATQSESLSNEFGTANWNNDVLTSTNYVKRPIVNLLSRLDSVLDLPLVNTIVVAGCDTVILKNGDQISAKISEIGVTEIKYKKCEYTDGPTYTILKSEVFMVRYSNGSTEIFANSGAGEKPKTQEDNSPNKKELTYSEKYNKGLLDATIYHKPGGWAVAGFLLGPIGVLIALLIFPVQRSPNTELSRDLAYREGYRTEARRMNISNALIGWLIWVAIFLLFLL